MHLYPRHDESSLSPHELSERWETFHARRRATGSSRIVQLVSPFIGESSPLRRWVLGRRPAASTELPNDVKIVAERQHYLTQTAALETSGGDDTEQMRDEIQIVAFDTADLNATFRALDQVLASSATWVSLVDPGATSPRAALPALWDHRTGADVVFADERPNQWPVLKCAVVGAVSLLSANVVGRPALLRLDAVRSVGGFDAAAGVAAEHDLYLRLQEAAARFVHVPVIAPNGRSVSEATDPRLPSATVDVVTNALARRGVPAFVEPLGVGSRVTWATVRAPQPRIDIVIPTRDRLDLLRRCIDSVVAHSTYGNYAITILDNDSVEPATLAYFASCGHRVVACPGPFNYAAIMNRGVASTTGEFFITLNNDTVVVTPDWIERLLDVAALPSVGLVGCRQIDQYGRHEHDGVVIAPYPQHLRYLENWWMDDAYVECRRNVAAVTGAVTMVRRSAWDAVGGMDETLAVVMNDIDVCLRLQNEGHDVAMVPDVTFRHDASSSRGRLDPLADRNRFVARWDIFGSFRDPYFPERLRLYGTRFVAE